LEVLRRLGEGFEVAVTFVDDIPRGPGGKYCFLEQRLDEVVGLHG
jgi:hypothetical protein